MRRIGKRVAYAVLHLYCAGCDHIIWSWQPRCGFRHTTCAHRAILASWRRNRDMTNGPERPWACSFCHKIPTEARP